MVGLTIKENQEIEMEFLKQYKDEDIPFEKKIKEILLNDDDKNFILMYKKNALKIRSIFNNKLERNLIILGKLKIIKSLIKIKSFQLDNPLSFYATLIIKNSVSPEKLNIDTKLKIDSIKSKFENQILSLKLLFNNGYYIFNNNYDWHFFFINLNYNLFSYNILTHLESIHSKFNINFNNDSSNTLSPICLILRGKTQKHLNILNKMIELGANINEIFLTNQNYDFPLKTAIEFDNLEGLKILLDNNVNYDKSLIKLIELAVENNNLKMVKLLFEKLDNANINDTDALYIACVYQSEKIVKYLLSINADPNKLSTIKENIEIPLEISLSYHDFNICNMLLNAGASPYYRNKKGHQTLELVVYNNDLESLIFLNKIKSINFNDEINGLFLEAISNASYEMVRWMINNGAKVNQTYYNNKLTPLTLALEKNRFDVVKLLIKHDAKIDIISHYRPLLAAFLHSDIEIINYLLKYTKIKIYSDLIQAIPLRKKDNIKAYEVLIKCGADINKFGLNGEFPMDSAISSRKLELIDFCLNSGADIYKENREGESILTHSVDRNEIHFFHSVRNFLNNNPNKNKSNIYYVSEVFKIMI